LTKVLDRELRVRQRGIRMPMAEEIADDLERERSLNQMRRQRMPQHVRTSSGGTDAGMIERTADDAIDRGAPAKRNGAPVVPDKDRSGVSARTATTEIGNERPTHSRGQWQHQRSAGLRSLHPHDPSPPVDVVDAKIHDFSSAEAINGEEQHDGVIATTGRRPTINAGEKPTDLVRADR